MCLHWELTTAACCSAGINVTVLAPPVRVLLVCTMCARAVLRCVLVCEGIATKIFLHQNMMRYLSSTTRL